MESRIKIMMRKYKDSDDKQKTRDDMTPKIFLWLYRTIVESYIPEVLIQFRTSLRLTRERKCTRVELGLRCLR